MSACVDIMVKVEFKTGGGRGIRTLEGLAALALFKLPLHRVPGGRRGPFRIRNPAPRTARVPARGAPGCRIGCQIGCRRSASLTAGFRPVAHRVRRSGSRPALPGASAGSSWIGGSELATGLGDPHHPSPGEQLDTVTEEQVIIRHWAALLWTSKTQRMGRFSMPGYAPQQSLHLGSRAH